MVNLLLMLSNVQLDLVVIFELLAMVTAEQVNTTESIVLFEHFHMF